MPPPPPAPPPPPPRARSRERARKSSSSAGRVLDVDRVTSQAQGRRQRGTELGPGLEGMAGDLQGRRARMRTGVYQTSNLPSLLPVKAQQDSQADKGKPKATFV